LPQLPNCEIVRLPQNTGKGAALRAGFARAAELGYTHAITMDADGQHYAEDLPKFLEAANVEPESLIVGVRDLAAAGCPVHRQRSNAVSSFWFRAETGVRLRDTQCGFRCYPLALVEKLVVKSGRYAFELEFMVRASWVGTKLAAVPVKCTYHGGIRNSHFRPVVDLWRITSMNILLVLQSWLVPRSLRVAWSFGKHFPFKRTLYEFFSEHAHEPVRVASAVGLGLFLGIAPIWGFQIISGVALSHWLRLNKAITVTSSHISLPPVVPFIWYAALQLGHRVLQAEWLPLAPHNMNWHHATEYFGEMIFGSILLALTAGVAGFLATWLIASLWRKK
jgi:uncharacterized protein (DUF2062 family)